MYTHTFRPPVHNGKSSSRSSSRISQQAAVLTVIWSRMKSVRLIRVRNSRVHEGVRPGYRRLCIHIWGCVHTIPTYIVDTWNVFCGLRRRSIWRCTYVCVYDTINVFWTHISCLIWHSLLLHGRFLLSPLTDWKKTGTGTNPLAWLSNRLLLFSVGINGRIAMKQIK